MNKLKWELKGLTQQIADTGDYSTTYEITNGKISIFADDSDDESLESIVDVLNKSNSKFWLDDSKEIELYFEKEKNKDLREELAKHKAF